MSWSWTYRPGEIVEPTGWAQIADVVQDATPRWSWLGGDPTPQVQATAPQRPRAAA